MKLRCVTGEMKIVIKMSVEIVSTIDTLSTSSHHQIWPTPGIIAIQSSHWHSRKQTFIAWHPKIASKMWQSINSTRNTITWTRKIALCVDGVIGCGYKNIFLSPMLLFIALDRDIESGSVMWCVNTKLFRTIHSGIQTNKDILWNSLIIYLNHNNKWKTAEINTRTLDVGEQWKGKRSLKVCISNGGKVANSQIWSSHIRHFKRGSASQLISFP